MKKIAIVIAGIAALIGAPAFAADMAVKAPPPAPPPAFNWTGWYVGVNGGLGVYSKESSVTGFNIDDGGQLNTGGVAIDPVGGFGGGQIGYNWQTAPNWVVGLEADIQGGSIRASEAASVLSSDVSANVIDSPVVVNATNRLDWFGSVRARVGYTFLDQRVLTYVTGGFAFGGVRDSLSVSQSSEGTLLVGSTASNTTKTGWIVGYGIEGYFTPTLSLRAESDYMSLGSTTLTTGTNCDENCFNDIPSGSANLNHKYWLFRVGLNYKFGSW